MVEESTPNSPPTPAAVILPEVSAAYHEVRYIVSNFSAEAIEQTWRLDACDVVISEGDGFPVKISYVRKLQKFKIEEYS